MFAYDMSKAGADSLYHYLYSCIKKEIVAHKILPDEKLPSKRSLAQNLGVSVVTVENAYAQLLAEGYIYSLPKKGFFVSNILKDVGPTLVSRTQIPLRKTRPSHKVRYKDDEPEKTELKYLADFASNGADLESFPFSTWAKITREVLCENQAELLQVSPGAGILRLRKAIAKMLREFRGIDVDARQIVVGAGTDYLYALLLQLLGLDKCYALEDPGYGKISSIYAKMGVDYRFIPVDGGLFLDALEKSDADVVHLSPSHHFPTGRIMPVGDRYRLLGWAAALPERYIVEDDYDSEFRMTGRPVPALQNIDVMGKVVYLNTFSKTMTSTVRLSYMVLPPALADKFNAEFSFYSCTVSNLDQYVMAKFMEEGYFENHINRMRNFYRGKRDLLLKAIAKSPLSKKATVLEEDAGLHFILQVQTKLSDAEFCKRAGLRGVNIRALSEYYFEAKASEHKFVVNYSSVDKGKMQKAVQILAEICG